MGQFNITKNSARRSSSKARFLFVGTLKHHEVSKNYRGRKLGWTLLKIPISHTHICIYMYIYIYVCVNAIIYNIYIYIYTYIYTYIYIYIHIYIYICVWYISSSNIHPSPQMIFHLPTKALNTCPTALALDRATNQKAKDVTDTRFPIGLL